MAAASSSNAAAAATTTTTTTTSTSAPSLATGEWSLLMNRYYRKNDVYEMLWGDIDLDKYIVVGAPFGGPIAMVPDERKGSVQKPRMRIYTSAGKPISEFTWQHQGLIGMAWNDRDNLACVLGDGTVYIYTVHGDRASSFSLGPVRKSSSSSLFHSATN
jgi:hypothetical protein